MTKAINIFRLRKKLAITFVFFIFYIVNSLTSIILNRVFT